MILDFQNLFSDGQAITATAVSTNIIDLGAPGSMFNGKTLLGDKGVGYALQVMGVVTEAFATLTSLQPVIQTDDNSAFSSPAALFTGAAVPVASLVIGYRFNLPALFRGLERYLRLNWVVAGSNATAGKVVAGLVLTQQYNP